MPYLWALLISLAVTPAVAAQQDPKTGLALEDGWELVKAHCGACHSYRLVTSQRGDAAFWLETIRWMQDKHNLWQLPGSQERKIVDYLAGNYDDVDWGRRPPLPAHLAPTLPAHLAPTLPAHSTPPRSAGH